VSLPDLRHDADLARTPGGIFQIMLTGVVIEGPVPAQSFIRATVEPITLDGDL
jgi:hypothetical protein